MTQSIKNKQILIRQLSDCLTNQKKNIISKRFPMNRSDRRLKTIESQQLKKQPHVQIIHPEVKKTKKESTRKISLKQSVLKQQREIYVPQLHPKSKRSQQITIDHDQKYKIIKELEILTRPQEQKKKSQKNPNLSKQNKSLIFSQHKLSNPHQISTLKASKLFPSESKAGSTTTKQKQTFHTYKKGSQKGSTTKKHSKSVYNYTEFDEYPQMKHQSKKHSKQTREHHNKSALTQQQAHQISTSSITKRVSKSRDILNKLLNSNDIKKKTTHFKILSGCLRSYVKDEELLSKKIDVGQIIKLVKAFNKVEIAKMSKPLEELISQMIELIQQTVEIEQKGKGQQEEKASSKKKQSSHKKYQTPQRLNQKFTLNSQSIKNKPKSFTLSDQAQQHPSDISKTKKVSPQDYVTFEPHDTITQQQNYQSTLSKDISKMQEGLSELMSESKQLKKFIHQSSSKKTSKYETEQLSTEKKVEIDKLKHILERQQMILQKLDAYESEENGRHSSSQSSLKYCYNQDE